MAKEEYIPIGEKVPRDKIVRWSGNYPWQIKMGKGVPMPNPERDPLEDALAIEKKAAALRLIRGVGKDEGDNSESAPPVPPAPPESSSIKELSDFVVGLIKANMDDNRESQKFFVDRLKEMMSKPPDTGGNRINSEELVRVLQKGGADKPKVEEWEKERAFWWGLRDKLEEDIRKRYEDGNRTAPDLVSASNAIKDIDTYLKLRESDRKWEIEMLRLKNDIEMGKLDYYDKRERVDQLIGGVRAMGETAREYVEKMEGQGNPGRTRPVECTDCGLVFDVPVTLPKDKIVCPNTECPSRK